MKRKVIPRQRQSQKNQIHLTPNYLACFALFVSVIVVLVRNLFHSVVGPLYSIVIFRCLPEASHSLLLLLYSYGYRVPTFSADVFVHSRQKHPQCISATLRKLSLPENNPRVLVLGCVAALDVRKCPILIPFSCWMSFMCENPQDFRSTHSDNLLNFSIDYMVMSFLHTVDKN